MRVGDLLLVPSDGKLITKIISFVTRSKWVHIACYVGNDKIIEANWGGVKEIPLYTYQNLQTKILRHRTASPYRISEAVKFMQWQLGQKYDYFGIIGIAWNMITLGRKNFLDNRNRYWCSELIADGYNFAGIKTDIDKMSYRVSPADFDRNENFMEVNTDGTD